MRFSTVTLLTLLILVPAGGAAAPARAAAGTTLVQLTRAAACTDAAALTGAGATLAARELRLYELNARAASRVLPQLRARGVVAHVEANRPAGTLARLDFGDPLVQSEWWRQAIGVDLLTPPGPGVPVTVVDSGIDVNHPEFLGRPNLSTLNAQEPAPLGGEHGTAVAALVGAPENGVGIVGVYPEAVLRSWDAAIGEGTRLETSEIVSGILAAAAAGPGVINLSLGGDERDLLIEQAVFTAVRKGSLVVAASGNEGDQGSPLGYPASIPHVLTVASTDHENRVSFFSSRSRFVDLAAPGEDIPIATALGQGFRQGDGTSFAAPLVSGAAAWVWTVRPELDSTQLFEVMRRSARDIDVPGRDAASGFGLLDVAAALAYPTPPPDPLEPNDDIDFLSPDGEYATGVPSLTTRARPSTNMLAQMDWVEDPRDVYRIWLPKGRTLRVTANATTDVDLGLWRVGASSVRNRVSAQDRLARAASRGTAETLAYRNAGTGRVAYLAVTLPKGVQEATYRVRVSVR